MIAPDRVSGSPNCTVGAITGKCVIIHCTRSGKAMNPSELEGTLNWMARADTVSSHWVISRTGEAVRVIADSLQAWHAQEDNDNAWGIELEQGIESDGFTPEQLAKLVAVCKGYVSDFGVMPVHTASSGGSGFIGHQETAQGRRNGKSDPGSLFSWEWFINAILEADVEELTPEHKRLIEDREGRVLVDTLLSDHYNTRRRMVPIGDDAFQVEAIELYNPVSGEVVASIPVPSLP